MSKTKGAGGEIQILAPGPCFHALLLVPPEFSSKLTSHGTSTGSSLFPDAVAYFDLDRTILVRRNRYPVKLVSVKGKERIFIKLQGFHRNWQGRPHDPWVS